MNKRHILVLLLVLLSLSLGAKQENYGSIIGKVLTEGGRFPMTGVEVACYRDSLLVDMDTTHSSGNYKIDKLTPGTYKMTFYAKNHEEKTLKKIKVKAGKNMIRDVAIDTSVVFMYFTDDDSGMNGGKLAVKVRDENGRSIQYVNVVLLQNDTRIIGTQTNEKGTVSVKNIPPGTYDVKFYLIGFAAQTFKEVQIEADKTTALNPRMKRAGFR